MTGRRVLLFITSFLFISFKSFSAVFTVTSNADSGPGTLREALTLAAANGSATKDYINFNLPDLSEAGRTITLTTSALPNISSSLVIDANSQPGSKLGNGDSKIKITCNQYQLIINDSVSGLFTMINISDVEIYGIYIYNYNNIQNTVSAAASTGIAVIIQNVQNLTFGAPGKGNEISDCDYEVSGSGNKNIKLSSNHFDQPYFNGANTGQGLFNLYADNLVIGGETPAEGNYIFTGMSLVGENVKIKNNHLGAGSANVNGFSSIEINNSKNVEISYNQSILFRLWIHSTNNFNIYANKDDSTYPGASLGAITILDCSDGVIGSEDENLRNVFYSNTGDSPDYISSTIVNSSSNNIQILKNEIICSRYAYTVVLEANNNINIPKIQVLVNNSIEYSGTASPNSDIYIYYDNSDCPVCSPLKFFQKIKADATGNWKITGNFAGKRWVANALLLNNSSEYTQPVFSVNDGYDYNQITDPSCGNNNGQIALFNKYYKNMIKIEWYNSNDIKVGEGPVIKNLGPGKYYAIGTNGECFAKTHDFFLSDVSPAIIDASKIITQPSCGVGGSIQGLITINFSQNPSSFKWINQSGTVVGTNPDINNLPAGEYTLTMTDDGNGCSTTYGPVILKNVNGPNINQSHANIQSTPCGQSTGSIKNIVVTGTGNIKYSWLNSQHQEVATSNDLTGQPAGIYTLKVTDDSQCGEIYSSEINIPETNGITLNENSVTSISATCSQNNGSVQGIIAPGATHYKWINIANNSVASLSINLVGAAAGNYRLTANNDFGCSKTSGVYTIEAAPATVYPMYSATINKSCAGQSNGSITLITDNLVKTMRWVDAAGQPAGTDAYVRDLKPGTYKVYFTDANGCETLYPHDFTVADIPPLQIDGNSPIQTNDECGLKTGSIKNIQVTGGTPPYTYLWVDAAGNHLSTSTDLTDVGEGSYFLQVHDSGNSICSPSAGITLNILNENSTIDAPVINPLQLCAPGEALLTVNSPAAGNKYRIYNSLTDPTYLDEQTNGIFKVSANSGSTFYISRVNGQCESQRTPAQITISLSAIDIPNAFTPNGDGKNDYWKISNAQNYPQAIIQVFTRYGQKVFESRGYSVPFDGTYKGSKLPSGVYYYILNLGKSCNLLSGSLSIIR